jgi:L-amino acid N-acyltransferase YncA
MELKKNCDINEVLPMTVLRFENIEEKNLVIALDIYNYKVLIASISGENTASLKLMRKLGYEQCGQFKNVGEKWGRILDVVYFQKELVA